MQVETSSLKIMADMVGVMSDTVTINPLPEYWEINAIDPSHVGMIRFRLNASALGEGYTPGEPFTIDVSRFMAILKDMGPDTDIEIIGQERVIMKSGTTTRRFTQKVALETPSQFPADRLPLESFVIFDPADIKSRMASLCGIGGTVKVALNADSVNFASFGDDEDMLVTIGMDKCKSMSGEAVASYPSEYMGKIFKTIPKDTSLQISYDTDMPILMKFTSEIFSAEFLVAPHIESE